MIQNWLPGAGGGAGVKGLGGGGRSISHTFSHMLSDLGMKFSRPLFSNTATILLLVLRGGVTLNSA